MDPLRESFLKTYANLPINLRADIILVLEGIGSLSWNAAYIEVENNSEISHKISHKILTELRKLELI